jgi:hypothetical protein
MRIKVHPVVSHMKAMLASTEKRTGKAPKAWEKIVRGYGTDDVNLAAARLKAEFGLGQPTAVVLASRALGVTPEDYDAAAYLRAAPKLYCAQYDGKKADLKPIADALIAFAETLGKDAGASPTKTMVPLYRHHVFAQVKAATQKRVDVGLALGGYGGKMGDRLKDTGGAEKGDRITHVIGISCVQEIDDEVKGWLRAAYELDEA